VHVLWSLKIGWRLARATAATPTTSTEENEEEQDEEEAEEVGNEDQGEEEQVADAEEEKKIDNTTVDDFDSKMTTTFKRFSMGFQCPFILYDYVNDGRKVVSVDMLIPPVHRRHVRLKIRDDGLALEVSIVVPSVFCDPGRLISANTHNDDFNHNTHKSTAFQAAAQQIKKSSTNGIDEVLGPKMVVKLPFKCETDFYTDLLTMKMMVAGKCSCFSTLILSWLRSLRAKGKTSSSFLLTLSVWSRLLHPRVVVPCVASMWLLLLLRTMVATACSRMRIKMVSFERKFGTEKNDMNKHDAWNGQMDWQQQKV
jgi:hypothetical protein